MKKNKNKNKSKKWFYFGLGGILVVLTVIVVVIFFTGNKGDSITGSSVSVNYYGVSNYPFNLNKVCSGTAPYCKKGVQTKVTITQPELGKLKVAGTAIDVAGKIVSAVDYGSNLVGMYQGSVPTPIPTDALGVVTSASGAAIDYFKKETSCLSKIGQQYGSKDKFEFGVISYLSYATCTNYPDWLYAYVKHEYRALDGKFICSQDGTKLFSVEMGTGKVSKSTFGC
ncbi:MAG: hypothetical protein V2A62_03345 [Candidatus Woesearchaeota archaeon]